MRSRGVAALAAKADAMSCRARRQSSLTALLSNAISGISANRAQNVLRSLAVRKARSKAIGPLSECVSSIPRARRPMLSLRFRYSSLKNAR
jgi:hypothetical protein